MASMGLRHFLTVRHRFAFYLFGLTSYPRPKNLRTCPKLFIQSLASVIIICLLVVLISFASYMIYFKTGSNVYSNGETSGILTIVYTGCIIVSNAMPVIRTLLCRCPTASMAQQCDRVEQQLKLYLFADLDLKPLRSWILLRWCFVAVAYLQSLIMFLVMTILNNADLKLGIVLFTLQGFSTVLQCYMVLHTESVHFVMHTINSNMKGDKLVQVTHLRSLQKIYFEVWRMVRMVNANLGSSFGSVLIVLVIDVVYDAFWLFRSLRTEAYNTEATQALCCMAYPIVCAIVLVDSCNQCSIEVVYLMENLEKHIFWSSDNEKLYHAKEEFVSIVNRFPIHFTANGFFVVDRRFLAAMVTACCTYILICIQFNLAME